MNGIGSSLVTNPDSISAVITIVFVCGESVVNASLLPLLYSDTPLPQLVRWYERHCLQCTVTPSIDPWQHMTAQWYVHDILQPHVLPLFQRLPGAIFQPDSARHTRQGYHKTISVLLLSFLVLPDLQICLQSSVSGIIWDGELGIP
ncbi:uncharacterized protein TNCV_4672491 [Trichonephila clavipes]|nr:uncharacterized protein TNCV_4672491 [Trichonephila clavipes]